jgi:hypothetical protein
MRLRTRIKEIVTFIVGHKKYIFFTIILNLIFIKPYLPKIEIFLLFVENRQP